MARLRLLDADAGVRVVDADAEDLCLLDDGDALARRDAVGDRGREAARRAPVAVMTAVVVVVIAGVDRGWREGGKRARIEWKGWRESGKRGKRGE